MSNISIKNIGSFKYNYKITDKKYNIFCISLFKMKDNYKGFSKYVNGILEINKYIRKYFPNFIIRLYFDKSVVDDRDFIKLYNILDKNNNQLVLYNCPNYKLDEKHHLGTFGSIIRYIPYFDFDQNDVNICVISDAEPRRLNKIKQFMQDYSKHINIFINSNALFFRRRIICSEFPIARYLYNLEDYTYGFYNASKIKLPLYLIQNFFTKEIFDIKYSHPEIYKKIIPFKKNNDKLFFYGIDEYFLSTKIKPFLDKNKITYMTNSVPHLANFYYVLENIIFKNSFNKNNKKKYDIITKIINNKINKNFNNFNKVIKYIALDYDYSRKTDKFRVYNVMREIFKKIFEKNDKKLISLLNINNYECLNLTEKYYDDTNNLIISN